VYHIALVGSKSQTELDRIHQLYVLYMSEDDKDGSWECTKVIEYREEKGMNTSTNHKCLALRGHKTGHFDLM
jgi:hypothetical protein